MLDSSWGERPLWCDKTGAPVVVSTVWLGLDYQYFSGPPLIFETMVFVDSETAGFDEVDGLNRRYAAEADALVGHEDVCELVRAMSGGVLSK